MTSHDIESVTPYDIESRTLAEQETAVEFTTAPLADIGAWLGKAFTEVASYLERKGAGPAGLPFARYRPAADGRFEVEAGFPASTPTSGEADVEPSDLPGGHVAVAVHLGPYDGMQPAYDALRLWVHAHGAETAGDPWEVYLRGPNDSPDSATWRTEIVQPYRTSS